MSSLNRALDAAITQLAADPEMDSSTRAIEAARTALSSRAQLPLEPATRTALAEQFVKLDAAQRLLEISSTEGDEVGKALDMARAANQAQGRLLGFDVVPAVVEEFPSTADALRALAERRSVPLTPDQSAELERLDGIDEPLRSSLRHFVAAFVGFDRATAHAFANVDLDGARDLLRKAETGELPSSAVPSGGPPALLAQFGIDLAPLLAARASLIDAVGYLYEAWSTSQATQTMTPFNLCPLVSVDFEGWDDYYYGDCILVVDAAGSDTYLNNAGGSGIYGDYCWSPTGLPGAAALVDFTGHDRYGYYGYYQRSCGANGGGYNGGAGFLFDGLGTDVYSADSYGTNGGSYVGSGFLVDATGPEEWWRTQQYYAGYMGTNGGAAGMGTGLLVDGSSPVSFSASSYATNGGATLGGVGMLATVGESWSSFGAGDVGTNGGGCGGSGFLLNGGNRDGGGSGAGTYGTNGGADGGIYPWVFCGYGSGFMLNTAANASHSGENGGARSAGVGTFLGGVGSNDYYAPSWGNGAAHAGIGLLVDPAGRSSYNGGNGGGASGAGMLVDLGDDGGTGDYYGCDAACNGGAAQGGSGFVYDELGNDTYAGNSHGVNGGGILGGSGYLHDAAGVDSYSAGTCGVNGGGYVSSSTCSGLGPSPEGRGTLLDTGGIGDSYADGDGGSGTDKTVVAKGSTGRQLDLPPINQAPTPSLVSPPAGHVFAYNATQSFTVSATDPEGDQWVAECSIGGAVATSTPTASGGTATCTPTAPLPPGSYTWSARAIDTKGNRSASTSTRSFTVAANQAPTPSLASPPAGASFATGAPVTFSMSATDPEGHQWVGRVEVRNSSGTSVGTYATTPTASGQTAAAAPAATLPPGPYTWTATATDANGATSAATAPRSFTVAVNQAPAPALVSPPAGHVFAYNATQSFTVSATDPEGDQWVAECSIGGTVATSTPTASGGTAMCTPTAPLPPGNHTWSARAIDTKGARSASTTTRTFTVAANQAPTPSLVSPADGASFATGAPVTFSMSATDPEGHQWVGRVEVRNSSGTTVGTFSTTPTASGQTAAAAPAATLPAGTYSWTATATDANGATSAPTGPRSFTVAANQAPTVTLVAPPDGHTFPHGATQSFTVSATDPEGDQWVAECTIGGAVATSTPPTPSGGTATCTPLVPLPPGSYTWSARAIDTKGNRSASTSTRSFTVAANQAPTPSLVSPADGASFATGAPVTFSMSATDPEGHQWVGRVEVRNSSGTTVGTYSTTPTASGQTATAVPPATLPPGTYTWTATVADLHGATSAATAARSFTVQPLPTNQAPTPSLVSPPAGHVFAYNATQSFTVSATDPEGDQWVAECSIGGAVATSTPTASGGTATCTPTAPLPPGSYTWSARAIDTKGAMSAATTTRTFTVAANQAPTTSLVSPADGHVVATGAPVTFSMSATDPEGHQWVGRVEVRNASGTPVGTYATTPTASGQTTAAAPAAALPPGTYTWTATATDANGAASAPTGSRSFTVAANQPPAVTLVSPPNGHVFAYNATQSFTVSATDPEGDQWVAECSIGGAVATSTPTASGGTATCTPTAPLPPGSYTWSARAIDTKGAMSAATTTRSFTVAANQAPTPSLVSPADGASFATGAPVTFSMSATDPEGHQWVGRVEVRNSSGTTVGTYPTTPTASGQTATAAPAATLPPGTYTWTATATDANGATSAATGSRSFTVNGTPTNQAPTVALVSPEDGHVFAHGEDQAFVLSATDAEGEQWVGVVEVRDASGRLVSVFPTALTASGQTATARPAVPLPAGSYTWTATASDTAGNRSPTPPTARSFVVAAPPPPNTASAGGFLAVNGQATLPKFPCEPPAPFGTGPCEGTFEGDWSGHLSGASGSSPYEVTWSAPEGVSATFTYAEWQCVGLEAVLGFAKGTGTASAGVGQVDGQWQVPGETFARDIVGVAVSFEFEWVRLGNVATIVMKPFSMTLSVSGDVGDQEVVTDLQAGAATFVAGPTDLGGPPSCEEPWTDVHGEIAGAVPLRQAPAA